MVRKVGAICLLIGCLLFASPMQALAYSVYEDGNISSTYTTIFRDILEDTNIFEDYVFFRSGQYEYTMIVGDITLSGTSFSAADFTEYVISYTSGSYGSTSNYSYTTSTGTNFSLSVSDNLVYSNLGHYPKLIERGVYYEFASLVTLCIIGMCMLMRPMFQFVCRLRK